MNSSFGKILQKHLNNEKIFIIDVGAKSKPFRLPGLSKYSNTIGFEPNSEELKNLHSNHEIQYFPHALSSTSGNRKIRITKHSSYSSFLQFDESNFAKHFHMMKDYEKWKDGFKVQRTITVPTKTIDEIRNENLIETIDCIKLDTQGTELEILKGGINAIKEGKIGLIFCEVNFVGIYKGQNLFSDLDIFLRDNNYEFIDCIYHPEIANRIKNPFSKKLFDKPKYSVGGDAVFVPNLDKHDLNGAYAFKMGLILASLGYTGIAQNFFEKSNTSKSEELSVLQHFNKWKPTPFLKNLVPPALLSLLKR